MKLFPDKLLQIRTTQETLDIGCFTKININPSPPRSQLDMEHYPYISQKHSTVKETLSRTCTPIYLCDTNILTARCRALYERMSNNWHQHIIGYSFKNNYQVARSGILQQAWAWAKVMSGREYRLDLDECEILRSNVASEKSYAREYAEFKQRIRILHALLDQVCNSKFTRHFYSSEECEQFRLRWAGSSSTE